MSYFVPTFVILNNEAEGRIIFVRGHVSAFAVVAFVSIVFVFATGFGAGFGIPMFDTEAGSVAEAVLMLSPWVRLQ